MNAQAHCGRMFSGLYPATRRNAEVKPFCAVMFKPPWPRGNHIRLECWLLYSGSTPLGKKLVVLRRKKWVPPLLCVCLQISHSPNQGGNGCMSINTCLYMFTKSYIHHLMTRRCDLILITLALSNRKCAERKYAIFLIKGSL